MVETVRTLASTAIVAVVLVGAAALGGALARRVRVDRVVGEIAAGLGVAVAAVAWAGPAGLDSLVPPPVMGSVKLVAEAGLALFLVGVVHELASVGVRVERRAVALVCCATCVCPLLLGAGLGLVLLPESASGPSRSAAFILFVAVAVSVTAVPVLARIVADRGIAHTRAARVSLSAAVVQDSVCWILLAVAVALHTSENGRIVSGLGTLACGVVLVLLVRRLLVTAPLRRLAACWPRSCIAVVVVAALGAAVLSHQAGMTAVFGAVVAGLAFPRDRGPWSSAVARVARPSQRIVPLYVAVSAAGAVGGGAGVPVWWVMGLVLGVALLGKAGAGYLAARVGRFSPADSGRVAAMMNTRGLTEVVVLQSGLAAGVVDPTLFVAFVLMTAATTLLTGPVVGWLDRRCPVPVEPVPPARYAAGG